MRFRSLIAALVTPFLGALTAAQAAEAEPPPKPAVPPGAYGVLRPADNPLVKPGGKVPVPTIVWDKIEVRPDHPRLLITKETLKQWAARFEQSPLMPKFKEAVLAGDALANALMYQLSGRDDFARTAIRQLLVGNAGLDAPYVFDWTYNAMTDEERRGAIERLWATLDMDRASGWPRCSPYTNYPDDPRPSEVPPNQWPRFYNWTFHDQDWARRYAQTYITLLALAGHAPRVAEAARNYWEYSVKDATLFLDHLRDGSYWQGYYWAVTDRIVDISRIFEVTKSACGVDYLDPQKHPWLANFGRWLIYCSDPDHKRVVYNYGDSEMVELGLRSYAPLLASGNLTKDPQVEWLARLSTPPALNWFTEFIYHDQTVVPIAPGVLPPARAFPSTGLAVMRTGWEGHDTWVSLRWCDWFDMHCHPDVGSFILYCRSPLAPDTGFYRPGVLHGYNYQARTVAHNTLTIRDPAARIPLNDGCQRKRDRRAWAFAIGTEAWLYNQDDLDRADLVAFETQPLYDYAAGTGANAYRAEDVKEFVRQGVLLRSGVFIVFDRVETTRPQLEKRWLMHLVGEPAIDGKLVKAEVKGHIEDYDGGLTVSKGTKGAAVRCHTLLPGARRIRKVGGAVPDVPIATLVRTPRSTQRMATGSRWEWTDPLFLYYNDPLTGKKLGAISIERDTPTDVEYEITDTELYLKLYAYERGRTDEMRLKLADYKTLLDLTRDIGKRLEWQWHSAVHYLPGYEYYNEGANYPPAYTDLAWRDPEVHAPELLGAPSDAGSWRIEVYPSAPAARDYFFHVMRIQTDDADEPGTVTLARDDKDSAEAKIAVEGHTYFVTFAKTGPIGGHIRIVDSAGKVVADKDFAKEIVQKD